MTVVGYERDFGDPDHYREELDEAVNAAVGVGGYLLGLGLTTKAQASALAPRGRGEMAGREAAAWVPAD